MSESNFPLPPATFEFLIFSLKTQAEIRLGLLNFGEVGQEEPDLPAARHAIDLLAMLAEKTRGNLSIEEKRLIENSLTELRFRFVQISDRSPAPAGSAATSSDTASSAGVSDPGGEAEDSSSAS